MSERLTVRLSPLSRPDLWNLLFGYVGVSATNDERTHFTFGQPELATLMLQALNAKFTDIHPVGDRWFINANTQGHQTPPSREVLEAIFQQGMAAEVEDSDDHGNDGERSFSISSGAEVALILRLLDLDQTEAEGILEEVAVDSAINVAA